MFTAFTFSSGSNPYIVKTVREFNRIINKYDVEQYSEHYYNVNGKRDRMPNTYRDRQQFYRDFAVEWQQKAAGLDYSMEDLIFYQSFFDYYGRRFGLLQEFHENWIC